MLAFWVVCEEMKRSYLAIVGIILIAIFTISVGYYATKPAPRQPRQYPTVVLGATVGILTNLDPGQAYGSGDLSLNNVVFDPLYEVPPIFPAAKLAPRLAASDPIVSADSLHWTIALRQGVKFQDGTPFNATAVKFSFDRMKDLKSYSSWILDSVQSIDIVDLYTVRLNLKYPNAALKGALTMPVAAPVSPSAVNRMGLESFQALPVGTGPFKYVEWVKGDHLTLAPFEDYWNMSRVPKVNVVYKIFSDSAALKLALEKGDVDIAWNYIAFSDYASLETDPSIKHVVAAQGSQQLLHLNVGMPDSPLHDVRVRKAIAFSIDQKEISEKIYHGVYTPSEETFFLPGFYPKPSWTQYKPTNIAKAKELLNAAGYPNGIDVTLAFNPVAFGRETGDVAALIREQLGRADIRVTLRTAERAALNAGQFEMSVGLVTPDYLDADSVASFVTSHSWLARKVRLNDTLVDLLAQQAVGTTDPAQREKTYGDLQDRLANLVVFVPLVNVITYQFYRTNVIGVLPYYFQYTPWWTIDKKTS